MAIICRLVVIGSLVSAGCGGDDTTECGAGTIELEGVCVPENGLECGEGTFEFGGECVSFDPDDDTAPTTTASPAGVRSRSPVPDNVVLSSDEPATIFFTRDGSDPTMASDSEPSPVTVPDIVSGETIRFFAIDIAGNVESTKTELYEVDVESPDRVSGLSAVSSGTAVTVTWLNPTNADFAGVLLAKTNDGLLGSAPEPGELYATGDTLPNGEPVILVGTDTAASDVLATPIGLHTIYAAWSFDDLGNYSPIRVSNDVRVPLPAQSATLSVALSGTVVVTSQPANLTVSATATYNDPFDRLTVDLTVRNDAPRLLFNLKALTQSIGQGTQPSPTFQGAPMTYFGPESLETGAMATRSFTLNGIDGTVDPVVVDLDLVTHPMIYGSHEGADSSGGGGRVALPRDGQYIRAGVLGKDGRFLFLGHKSETSVYVVDTTTLAELSSVVLADSGSIAAVGQRFDGGTLYVVVNIGGHYKGGNGGNFGLATGVADLVALDPMTLEETGRLRILSGDRPGMTARSLCVSPNGDVAIVSVALKCNGSNHESQCSAAMPQGETLNETWLVDLEGWTLVDTDDAVEGVQPVVLGALEGHVEHCAWSADGETFFVGFNNLNIGGNSGPGILVPPVEQVDLATFTVTDLAVTNGGFTSSGLTVARGKLFYTSRNRHSGTPSVFTVFDLQGNQSNPDPGFGGSRAAAGVVFDPSGDRYYVAESWGTGTDLAVFDASTDTRIDMDGDGTNGVTNLDLSTTPHSIVISPF
jgi:hypothetical protein